MSKIKVNSLEGVGASTPAISIDNASGTCTANITNNLSNRNLVINGAMQVAQRGTSSTTSGYGTVDRFKVAYGGTDEAPTQAQVDVASGTTPYSLGFRKALKITNGNQTGGAGATDYVNFGHKIEAQDIANSGWNYTSTSSFITLQFWIKSSVAQVFYGYLMTRDGTEYSYPFSTGSLSADTWTKVTKTIPGNSNLQFDDNNGSGLEFFIDGFLGTDYTDNSRSLDSWAAQADATHFPDMTSTWYTTNDATLEFTGVQLEVGSQATAFEHRSYHEEIRFCERYFQTSFERGQEPTYGLAKCIYNNGRPYSTSYVSGFGCDLRTEMRATPSFQYYTSNNGTSSTANTVSGYNGSSWGVYSVNTQSASNTKKVTFDGNMHSGIVLYQFNYKADAEL